MPLLCNYTKSCEKGGGAENSSRAPFPRLAQDIFDILPPYAISREFHALVAVSDTSNLPPSPIPPSMHFSLGRKGGRRRGGEKGDIVFIIAWEAIRARWER